MSDSGERERSSEGPFEQSRVMPTGNDHPTKAENSFQEARKIPPRQILLLSESLATDGGLIAIADVSEAMRDAGLEFGYRVVGGIAVMLHVLRTGVDIPIRSTGDADYGVPLSSSHRRAFGQGDREARIHQDRGESLGASSR